jgi:hypothetical protein
MTQPDRAGDSIHQSAQPLCVKCGYDLSGLDPGGTCPECGAPVAGALRGDSLSAADPTWLRKVHRGLILITIGCLLALSRPLQLLVPDSLADVMDRTPISWQLWEIAATAVAFAFFVAGVVWVTGVDPRLSLSEQPTGLRGVTRATALAALVLAAVNALVGASGATMTGAWDLVSQVGTLVGLFLFFSAVIGVTYYLARLAERIPEPERASRLRWTARAALIFFPLMVVLEAVVGDKTSTDLRHGSWVWVPVAIVHVIAMLGSVAVILALMFRWMSFRRPIRRCLVETKARVG